jgi:hypothetical protein
MALIEINRNPGPGELRWFGLLLALTFGVIGAVVFWRFQGETAARVLWITGGGLALVYYAVPPLRKPMAVGWSYLTFPIGWIVSHTLLALVFYLVLTPIGLVMRLVGHDPMRRRFDPEAATYWIEHRPDSDPGRYFRQF